MIEYDIEIHPQETIEPVLEADIDRTKTVQSDTAGYIYIDYEDINVVVDKMMQGAVGEQILGGLCRQGKPLKVLGREVPRRGSNHIWTPRLGLQQEEGQEAVPQVDQREAATLHLDGTTVHKVEPYAEDQHQE